LKLAANTADVIAKTARLAMVEIEMPELTPLFDAICDGVKDEVNAGQIGPSSLASLRAGYDDLQESELAGAFFLHVGLPANCEWEVFKTHYWLRGRIDFKRHANDLRHFPPIAKALVDAA
jgi:hypothetical protein